MSAYFTLAGSPALSGFRIARLLEELRRIEPRIDALESSWFYPGFADRELDELTRARLQSLVDDAAAAADADAPGEAIWVVPRLGTISPWASKATDIAHNCGFETVGRIERGIVYRLATRRAIFGGGKPLDETVLRRLADVLHDRMTETALLERPDPARLFASLEGRPMQRVAPLARGRDALVEEIGRAHV